MLYSSPHGACPLANTAPSPTLSLPRSFPSVQAHAAPTLVWSCPLMESSRPPCCAYLSPSIRPCCACLSPSIRPCCAYLSPSIRPCCACLSPVVHTLHDPMLQAKRDNVPVMIEVVGLELARARFTIRATLSITLSSLTTLTLTLALALIDQGQHGPSRRLIKGGLSMGVSMALAGGSL